MHTKRCLARKRITEIKTEIEDPNLSLEDREKLLEEKAEKEQYLKTTAAYVNCAKSPKETTHPTMVSDGELALLKKGESLVLFPYIAEEGKSDKGEAAEKKAAKAAKGAGCTIG